MSDAGCHKNFPLRIVMLRASLFIALLAILSAMVFQENSLVGAVYLLSMLAVFAGMMSMACTRCDYYLGVCDNGLSVLTRHLFRQKEGLISVSLVLINAAC